MTAGTRLVQIPINPGNGSHVNKVDSILVYANTDTDALAIAKNVFNYNLDALWALATITQPVAATDMTGWSARIRVASSTGVVKADVTATAAGGVATKAFGTLTFTGQPLDTETVVINSKTYTFQSSLTNTDGHVKIGADEATSIANLVAAITGGAGSGTAYAAATVTNTDVTAVATTTTAVLTALAAGAAGNAITTTETLTNGSFGAATLTQGADAASMDAIGEELVTLLNASLGADGSAHITHAAYVASTDTLTVAGTADGLGDHTLTAYFYPPSGSRVSVVSFVGVITHQGSAGSALTVVLTSANPIPSVPVLLASHPFL